MNQMQPIEPAKRSKQSKGISTWTVLTICLVLAVLGLCGLGYALYHANSEKVRLRLALEAQQNEIDRRKLDAQKADEQGKLTNARNQQEQLLAQVSAATNSLLQLLAGSDRVRTEAAALGTNEAGRAVALHPELVRLAGRVFESGLPEIPPEPDITTRLEAVRRIEQQVLEARGTTYEPAPALGVTVQNANLWAEQGTLKVGQMRDALSSLVRDSKVKFTRATLTADSPILSAAIAKQNEVVAGDQIRLADQTASAARTNAMLTRAEADAAAAKTHADAEAAALKEQAEAEREKILAAARKVRAEADSYAEELRRKLAEDEAARERAWQQRLADLRLLAATNQVVAQAKTNQARNVELRQKASTPDVQLALAPFITPGYSQVQEMDIVLKPLSYSALDGAGALAPDIRGLSRLVTIACASKDKVRPRWKMNPGLFMRHPDELEKVKQAQALLIELGPVLVEMGQLQP
jgi:hypothetical protein